MTTPSIHDPASLAWIAMGALSVLALLADALRRLVRSRNAPLTASEWLRRMRALPPGRLPHQTQEGAAGVSYALQQEEEEELQNHLALVKPARKNGTGK